MLRLLHVHAVGELLILIADASLHAVVQTGLVASGHTGVVVTTTDEALSLVEGTDAALVEVPAGLEALHQLAACRTSRRVIAVTGRGSEELAVRAFRSGATDYLAMPFGATELAEAIARATVVTQRRMPEGERVPSLRERVATFERSVIRDAMFTTGGNQSETARRLRLTRGSLYDKLKKHRLIRR